MMKLSLVIMSLAGLLAASGQGETASARAAAAASEAAEPLDAHTLNELKNLYKQLIESENQHDLKVVKTFLWTSAAMLFVAKTKTVAEGNWAGFWGTDLVIQHFHDLYQGPFRIDPDYAREKTVGLTRDVAETYVPVKITVAYGGQEPVPKPFLTILEWISTPAGWKLATDIALPIPSSPPQTM
jgi:hypothetical protein